jgi:hypothetical protein
MKKTVIIPRNVIDNTDLSELVVDQIPDEGDPVEVDRELYFVCDQDFGQQGDNQIIGVIPLVVRNPSKVPDIKKYIECLSIAQRRVKFKNANGDCDFDHCVEMTIS